MAGGLEFVGVGKSFAVRKDTVRAMSDFSLRVAEGEFVAILGPSGCGKSTALRIAAGLETADTGTVTVGGSTERPDRGELGVAFQDNALLPWLTVRGNIELPYRLVHRAVEPGRVDALIELVGLTDFANARPAQLSGGMRQRVSIARSLVLRPSVLLLDEPFGALDAVTRHRLNMELARILDEERATTVLVTHSVEESVFLADRVVVMSGRPGRVKQIVDVPFGPHRDRATMLLPEFGAMVTALTIALDDAETPAGGVAA